MDRHVLVGLFCGRITPAGVEGVACVMVGAKTIMHRNRDARPARERYRGAPDEVFRREWLPSSKLCHDVGEREGEVAQVLLGRPGSQEGAELALEPPIVEVKESVASGGAGPTCVQLQLLKRLSDHVEAGEVERLDGGGSLHQPSLHRDD